MLETHKSNNLPLACQRSNKDFSASDPTCPKSKSQASSCFLSSSMANHPYKPNIFILFCFLFILSLPHVFVNSNSIDEQEHDLSPHDIKQEVLLTKLEELLKNLSEIAAKLDSRLSESPLVRTKDHRHVIEDKDVDDDDVGERKYILLEEEGSSSSSSRVREGEKGKVSMSVKKYSPFWSERFQFVSAVKLDSDATCVNVLPFKDFEGLSKYVAVGDDEGRVYVFLRNGDALVEHYTGSNSPVTSMVSYMSVYKNESYLVTGHQNGDILLHKLWEGSNAEEWNSLSMESVGSFAVSGGGEEGLAITIVEVHLVGRMRYVLAVDVSGKIRVYRENRALYGSAMPLSRPLVFLKQRLLFLTETGAGSLDLRTMSVKESECEGLNHSRASSYVFDATERSKAYGFTTDSDLIHVLLWGDMLNFKCRVRSKKKLEIQEPLAFHAIKGYLLVVNEEKAFVYNVSSQHYVWSGGPRLLFSAGLDEIRSSFLNYQVRDASTKRRKVLPLVASDREKLIVLGLGGGYVGMYRSKLPVFKAESSSVLWTSPVLFFILFLFGAWHFFAKKKEALTSWGPDDPFSSTSPTTGAPLGSSTSERSFVESSSRSSDIIDARGGALRGPTRRYGSPTRYPGGATGSFRLGPTETGSRPAPLDPNFRSTAELKYRGSALEPTGFAKKRDPLFPNSQVVDDNN